MGKATLGLFLAFSVYVTQLTSQVESRPTTKDTDLKVLSLLHHYETNSAKLRERVRGDEGLLVLKDSAQRESHESNSSKCEGENKSSNSLSSASGSGESSASGAGDDTEERLNAELRRMTTVIYDCKTGTETIGNWTDETRVLAEFSSSHTKDSIMSERRNEADARTARFIFGEDDREYSYFPQCAIARVTTGCTAFFIGPYHALTAAHCVNNFRYGWKGRIQMWRERNCHIEGFTSTCSRIFAVLGHTHHKLYAYDYALVEMDPSGEPAPCWFGIGYVNPWGYPSNVDLKVLGYPYDKRSYSGQPGCSYEAMWLASCNVSYRIRHQLLQWCDAVSGNSGSPVYSDVDQNKVVYGIHAQSVGNYVYTEDGNRTLEKLWNQGPMITPLRYFQILRWMNLSENSE